MNWGRVTMSDKERAPSTEEKVKRLDQYADRKELSPPPCDEYDDWYFNVADD